MTTALWIVAIFACFVFARYAFAIGAEINELRDHVGRLQMQLISAQSDLRTNTDLLASVQRDLAELKPKHFLDEYDGPDIVVPEPSAAEREKIVSQQKILMGL